jgi:hypothetical protein
MFSRYIPVLFLFITPVSCVHKPMLCPIKGISSEMDTSQLNIAGTSLIYTRKGDHCNILLQSDKNLS